MLWTERKKDLVQRLSVPRLLTYPRVEGEGEKQMSRRAATTKAEDYSNTPPRKPKLNRQ